MIPFVLDENEKEIFNFLQNVSDEFELEIELRAVGGWCRDKLLGIKSKDLDIAIGNMEGRIFCEFIEKYQKKEDKHYKFHIIKKQAEKSKHLETATTKILDYEIDFVNLRKESYTQESRIPIMVKKKMKKKIEKIKNKMKKKKNK